MTDLVRYCPACSHVGEVRVTALNCCPEHRETYIPTEIALQAKYGFAARLKDFGNPFEQHDREHHA